MRRPDRPRPDINVTPLVDVVLVLLIIFMVVLPQMEAGASVSLPGMQHPDGKASAERPITISLTAAGGLYLEKRSLSREALVEALRDLHTANPGRRVILKGDKGAPYGQIRAVFRECRALGFSGISLQVGDRRPGQKPKES